MVYTKNMLFFRKGQLVQNERRCPSLIHLSTLSPEDRYNPTPATWQFNSDSSLTGMQERSLRKRISALPRATNSPPSLLRHRLAHHDVQLDARVVSLELDSPLDLEAVPAIQRQVGRAAALEVARGAPHPVRTSVRPCEARQRQPAWPALAASPAAVAAAAAAAAAR